MAERVLIVGAGSYVGGSILTALSAAGCQLSALARSEAAAEGFERQGIQPVRAQIDEVAEATGGLRDYDACIWLSFVPLGSETGLVKPLLDSLAGSGKAFIFTSGTAVIGQPSPDGHWSEDSFAEDTPFIPPPRQVVRVATENFIRSYARRGVRAQVVRPPMIWGNGGSRQIPWIFETVRKAGDACYIGLGLNLYSHVHVDDVAALYLLALRKGVGGALYHAVAGEANFRSLAEAVAQVMGCAAVSVNFDRMGEILGRAVAETGFAINSRSRAPRSRAELGWVPRHLDIIDDIRNGSYRARFAHDNDPRAMELEGSV